MASGGRKEDVSQKHMFCLEHELKKVSLRKIDTRCSHERYNILNDKNYWRSIHSIHQILPNLFLTSAKGASNKKNMLELGITHVLIPANTGIQGVEMYFPETFCYNQFDLKDTPDNDILSKFDTTFKWIDSALAEEKNKVLVHCARGVSRSASFVIGYIMYIKNMNYEQALEHVTQIRPHVSPNIGFVEQLKKYYTHLGYKNKFAYDKESVPLSKSSVSEDSNIFKNPKGTNTQQSKSP
jgi:atypical dual specificity phosphatase